MAERFDTGRIRRRRRSSGLAAAIAARQAGLAVTLADAARPPIDKACGEGIMPEGVAALGRARDHARARAVLRARRMRFIDSNGAIDARFPRSAGFGVRRTVLHQLLIDRPLKSGSTCAGELAFSSSPTAMKALCWMAARSAAGGLIGADGQNSRLRTQAGLDPASAACGGVSGSGATMA